MLAYSGKGKFVSVPLDINEVVEEMAHLLEVSISKKAVLHYNLAKSVPLISADPTQIHQIVMNLITNASEAIGERSGVITISTGAMYCSDEYLKTTYADEALTEGNYVSIEVSDNGCGMDEETRQRIFDPFFTTKFTGRGLGLAAALGIVRSHNGAMKVYSEPGQGTSFKLLLPALPEDVTVTPAVPKDRQAFEARGTILLVDDEEAIRALGKRMIERMGFDVILAKDGREAVQTFKDNVDTIDCVLLDLTMPHMDGEEAFRELRAIREDVRVVLCSGYNEQDISKRFVGRRLAGFVQKPYQSDTLRQALQAAFEPEP